MGGVLSDVYFTVVMNDNFGRGHACSNWTSVSVSIVRLSGGSINFLRGGGGKLVESGFKKSGIVGFSPFIKWPDAILSRC